MDLFTWTLKWTLNSYYDFSLPLSGRFNDCPRNLCYYNILRITVVYVFELN